MNPLKVLLVDDSSSMRAILKKILRISGLPLEQTYEATNGIQGLEVLAQQPVDLILVDLNMPEMGGMEFIEHVKSKPDMKNVVMIVVSTESSQTRIDQIAAQGVSFIHKPFTPEQVREKVQNLLEGGANGSH